MPSDIESLFTTRRAGVKCHLGLGGARITPRNNQTGRAGWRHSESERDKHVKSTSTTNRLPRRASSATSAHSSRSSSSRWYRYLRVVLPSGRYLPTYLTKELTDFGDHQASQSQSKSNGDQVQVVNSQGLSTSQCQWACQNCLVRFAYRFRAFVFFYSSLPYYCTSGLVFSTQQF